MPIDGLKVIETLRWSMAKGFHRLPRHLNRAAETCAKLSFPFDALMAQRAMAEAAEGTADLRVRLTVDRYGKFDVTAAVMPAASDGLIWQISLSSTRVRSDDSWLSIKTTNRKTYDDARAQMPNGVDEVIFANERDEMCEGSITNIFLDFGQGLVTPPISSGLLPGVLREELIAAGEVRESVCKIADLNHAKAVWVGNSLRGLVRCKL
ncbi:MAG: aminotransferase class IV family protein [Pikeienuella sp.]